MPANDDNELPKKENASPTASANHVEGQDDDASHRKYREDVGEDSPVYPGMPSFEEAEVVVEPDVR